MRIILGTDGTGASAGALEWAAARAMRDAGAAHIVVFPITHSARIAPVDSLVLTAERLLRDRAPGVRMESSRHLPGSVPGSTVGRTSGEDLLVVDSLQSICADESLMRFCSESGMPIVVVPAHWTPVEGAVIVGIKDDLSAVAADVATVRALASSSTIVAVHVWQMPLPRIEGAITLRASPIQIRAKHRSILREAAHRLGTRNAGIPIERVLVEGNPAPELLGRARNCSLLVIGTRRRGPVLGSIGQAVLSGATTPVLIVPASAPDAECPG